MTQTFQNILSVLHGFRRAKNLKFPQYAILNIAFHALCNVAVRKCKLQNLWIRQCLENKVTVS